MFMKSTPTESVRSYKSKEPADVEARAKAEVIRLGGNPSDRTDLLGQFEVQFGQFKGKTFRWLLENGLGYSAWIATSTSSETATSAPLSVNKHAFKEYLKSFPEGNEALAMKAAEKARKKQLSTSTDVSSGSSSSKSSSTMGSTSTVASLVGRSSLSPQAIAR